MKERIDLRVDRREHPRVPPADIQNREATRKIDVVVALDVGDPAPVPVRHEYLRGVEDRPWDGSLATFQPFLRVPGWHARQR